MKALMTGLIVLAALIAHAEPSAPAAKTTTANAARVEQAKKDKALIQAVKTEYKKFGKNVSGVKEGCYVFKADIEKNLVTQSELHNKACGGDPATFPTIARYEVKDGKVSIEDPVSQKMIPFDKNFRSDGP